MRHAFYTFRINRTDRTIVAIKSCNGVIVPIDFDYFSRRNVYLPSAHYGHYVIHKKKDT